MLKVKIVRFDNAVLFKFLEMIEEYRNNDDDNEIIIDINKNLKMNLSNGKTLKVEIISSFFPDAYVFEGTMKIHLPGANRDFDNKIYSIMFDTIDEAKEFVRILETAIKEVNKKYIEESVKKKNDDSNDIYTSIVQ